MSYQLQSKPLIGPLADVFPGKTIRELSYRELRSVMASAPKEWQAESVAAASIGVPLEELLDMPGRYAGAMAGFLGEVTEMHGLNEDDEKLPVGEVTELSPPSDNAPKH